MIKNSWTSQCKRSHVMCRIQGTLWKVVRLRSISVAATGSRPGPTKNTEPTDLFLFFLFPLFFDIILHSSLFSLIILSILFFSFYSILYSLFFILKLYSLYFSILY